MKIFIYLLLFYNLFLFQFKSIAITTLDEQGLDLSILDILNQFY